MKKVVEKWNELTKVQKIAIVAGTVVVICGVAFLVKKHYDGKNKLVAVDTGEEIIIADDSYEVDEVEVVEADIA